MKIFSTAKFLCFTTCLFIFKTIYLADCQKMYYLCTEPKAIFFTLRFLPVELIERSDRDGYLLSFFITVILL